MLIFSFNFLIVHRRRKTRGRKYEPSNSNICCSLGNSTFLQNVFPEAGNGCCIKHYFWSADSSKALPATGIILGSMIGIGMTLNSDPFLLFRNCRGRCDEYRYMITPNVSSVFLYIHILSISKWHKQIYFKGRKMNGKHLWRWHCRFYCFIFRQVFAIVSYIAW